MNQIRTGMDWIAATTTDPNLGERWYMDYLKYQETRPLFAKDWTHVGGYVGREVEGFAWGYSHKLGFIVRGTGATAMVVYPSIQHEKARVTRLDLRVDVLCETVTIGMAEKCYKDNEGKAHPQYRLSKSPTGETCYIGSMSSDKFARLYDKSGEQGLGLGLIWRYEVVYRKDEAMAVMPQLTSFGLKGIAGIVYTHFSQRNAPMLFDAETVVIASTTKRESDIDAKLRWLRSTVQRTVVMLISAGYERETLEALGIVPQPYREFDKSQ